MAESPKPSTSADWPANFPPLVGGDSTSLSGRPNNPTRFLRVRPIAGGKVHYVDPASHMTFCYHRLTHAWAEVTEDWTDEQDMCWLCGECMAGGLPVGVVVNG